MLSQGFKLMDCQVKQNNINAHIQDLKRSGTLTADEKIQREIHCTQFLYNIWDKFETDIVKITYYDSATRNLYEYSVNGEVCQDIATGILEFMNLFQFISIKKLF
jgi:hypothetical protein